MSITKKWDAFFFSAHFSETSRNILSMISALEDVWMLDWMRHRGWRAMHLTCRVGVGGEGGIVGQHAIRLELVFTPVRDRGKRWHYL